MRKGLMSANPMFHPNPYGAADRRQSLGASPPPGEGAQPESLPRRPHHGARSLCSSLLLGGVYSSAQSSKGCRRFQAWAAVPAALCPQPPRSQVDSWPPLTVSFSRLPAPVHLSPRSMAQRNWPPPGSPLVLLSLRDSAASALHSPRRCALEAGHQVLSGGDSLDPPHKALLVQNADSPEAHILATPPPFHLRQLQSRGWRWTCSRTQIWGSSDGQMGSLFVFGQK